MVVAEIQKFIIFGSSKGKSEHSDTRNSHADGDPIEDVTNLLIQNQAKYIRWFLVQLF